MHDLFYHESRTVLLRSKNRVDAREDFWSEKPVDAGEDRVPVGPVRNQRSKNRVDARDDVSPLSRHLRP